MSHYQEKAGESVAFIAGGALADDMQPRMGYSIMGTFNRHLCWEYDLLPQCRLHKLAKDGLILVVVMQLPLLALFSTMSPCRSCRWRPQPMQSEGPGVFGATIILSENRHRDSL